MNSVYGVTAIVLVCLATLGVGAFGLRLSRTTSDFYVAGRTVTPYRNASAIGGEYLSAASFLGIAGLVYSSGLDMLWFPVGYTVGYIVLLVLVAAPLRRSGAYTLPDFAEARLESSRIRLLSSLLVVGIGWLYLLPQLQGAGLALRVLAFGAVGLGGLPLLFLLVPDTRTLEIAGLPFPWLVLGVLVYPVGLLVAHYYVRQSERIEREFSQVVARR